MTSIQELITYKENIQNSIQGNATRATLPVLDVGTVVPTGRDQLQYGAAIGAITKRPQLAKSFYEWPLFKIHVSKFLLSHCNMGTQPEAIATMLYFGDVNYNTTQGNQSYFDELYRRLIVNYFDETLFIKYHYSGRGFELFGNINKDYQTISIGNEISMFRNFIDNYRNYDDYKLNKELDICSYYVGGFKTSSPTLYLMKMNNDQLTEFLSKNNGLTTRRDLLQLSTDELSRLENNMAINFNQASEQVNYVKHTSNGSNKSFSKGTSNNQKKKKKGNNFNSSNFNFPYKNNYKSRPNNYHKRGHGYSHRAHHLNYEPFSDDDDYANLNYAEHHPDWEDIETSYNTYATLAHLSETDWEDIAESDTYSDTEWEDIDDEESSTSVNSCYNTSHSVPEDPLFVLDTGSTIHIVNDKSLLTDVRPSSTRIISIHNKHPIQYVGDIHIGKVTLENVALVEHSPSNIISVQKLNKIGIKFETTDEFAHL